MYGDHMKLFHKVECAVCGKKRRIIIVGKKILSRWGYFGFIQMVQAEYWECPKCLKGYDDIIKQAKV